MRFVGLIAGFAIAAAALAACGGGDETETPPTSTAPAAGTAQATAVAESPTIAATLTVEERAEAEALLKAASLRAEDVPEGLLLEDEGFATNEELGEVGDLFVDIFYSAGGVSLKDRFSSSGRILGYHAAYKADVPSEPSSLSGTVSFSVSVDLYRDEAALHADSDPSCQHLPDETEVRKNTQELYEALGMELRDLSVSSLPFAEVGDERFALEIRTTVRVPDLDTDLHTVLQWVCIQRDRLFGSLMMTTVNASPPVEELEALARTLDQRMKDALEQAPVP